ncbi:glycosyltransferase family 1 protein [Persicitalea jodogahamensis]|uniref:Glycosyl transferase n=1 Tax=Persicitalea jodogahamensis TaxID=402147 RepID=A0A8J3D2V3_9BACT|nr:glycosyltransferase family 1 protein [Persicitalea jodogahamensis]GHB61095.1 glycosyl transferase [Persicitalea jodogahamensis]
MKDLPENLLCFSHLRWDFVYQRPQHLLTRLSEFTTVYFLEEPVFDSSETAWVSYSQRLPNLWVCVPHLPHGLDRQQINDCLRELLDGLLVGKDLKDFTFWYYTPMALEFSDHLVPRHTVYDCMDELSAFKFAPQELKELEEKLFSKAHVVFTGGHSLYEFKKKQHLNTHFFPSSIDKSHFVKARKPGSEPADQAIIAGPKIGFYGVIDERFDIELIRGIAEARPDWHIVLIGPIVKIDPAHLPQLPNIHYLGSKSYDELPGYLSGWEVALIPFLRNESTRFISPTKTPEYLAGGKPVVSTPIRDVVHPYGVNQLVAIGETTEDFVTIIDKWMMPEDRTAWLRGVDEFLDNYSWDLTVRAMIDIMHKALNTHYSIRPLSTKLPELQVGA